ncbi:hypothetical protein L9F63_013892 [Diploptera punctata]|uniref:Uncharacterized protein n=1 Tax=Diploptera punctata TaxID=6984 RepID=A0AAD8A9Z0_DIPPU|nr:hypothetical protein L9F63_013892 [Diploptera punctata]
MVHRSSLPKMWTSVYLIFLLALLIVESQSQYLKLVSSSRGSASGSVGPGEVMSKSKFGMTRAVTGPGGKVTSAIGGAESTGYDEYGKASAAASKKSAAIVSMGSGEGSVSDSYGHAGETISEVGGVGGSLEGEASGEAYGKMRSAAFVSSKKRGDRGRSLIRGVGRGIVDCGMCGIDGYWGDGCEICGLGGPLRSAHPIPSLGIYYPSFDVKLAKARIFDREQNDYEGYDPRENAIRKYRRFYPRRGSSSATSGEGYSISGYPGGQSSSVSKFEGVGSSSSGRATAKASMGDILYSESSSNYGVGSGVSGDAYSSAYDPFFHHTDSVSSNSPYFGPMYRIPGRM